MNNEERIYEMLPGNTASEKFENFEKLMEILNQIAYPRRGSEEENMSLIDFATKIQEIVK